MSNVTSQDIKKIARLARIEVPKEKHEDLARQLNGVINWVGELNEVNTDNVEALSAIGESVLRLEKDEISDGNIAENILKNAKTAKYGYFSVPKVIE